MKTRGELNTEKRNPNSHTIDSLSVDEILSVIMKKTQLLLKKLMLQYQKLVNQLSTQLIQLKMEGEFSILVQELVEDWVF